jgi:Protoglobin
MTSRGSPIAGYDFGQVPASPVTLEELRQLLETIGFTEEDRAALSQSGDLLNDDAEGLVDGWRKIIGDHDQLAKWFFGPDGKPDDKYKSAVKPRFVRWVLDVWSRPFDQTWLDYQNEIGLRHTPAKKNLTDGVQTPPVVPLRYLIAFIPHVLAAVRSHLQAKGAAPNDVDRMSAAWTKAVLLSIALWSRPYTRDGLW